jgi:hypothetical protein
VAALVWQLRNSGDRLSLRARPRPGLTLVRTTPIADEPVSAPPAPVEPARSVAA